MWFSQAALSAWQSCPLKYKYRYLDGLYWPLATGGQLSAKIERGRQFHLLAQRYFGGWTGNPPGDPLLADWLEGLRGFLPLEPGLEYLPEYELRLGGAVPLLAKFDLLVVGPGAVTIYDWKTEDKPPGSGLAAAPQSRLYLYLLSASGYFPQGKEAAMVYWNPRFPKKPLRLEYSARQEEEDGVWLKRLAEEITGAAAFPPTQEEKNCRYCEYRPVCHGQSLEDVQEELLDTDEVDWDQVQEIELKGVIL